MLSLLFHRRPRYLVLLLVLVMLSGLSALLGLPRLEDPTLSPRFATLRTAYPGASAERVETLVTTVLEEEISEVADLRLIRSASRAGFSLITLELKDNVEDLEAAWTRIREKIDLVEGHLPQGAGKPELKKSEVRAFALIVALVWDGPEPVNEAILRRQSEHLEETLLGLEGSEKLSNFGEVEEEVSVALSQEKLTALGLSINDIAGKIARSEARLPAGSVRGAGQELHLELDTEFDSLQRLRELPIVSTPGQAHLELQEIAQISKGIRYPTSERALVSGQPAQVMGVYLDPARRVDQWTVRADQALRSFEERLPEGIRLQVLFRQGDYVEHRLDTLAFNLGAGAAAVMVVIFLMMGWRSALVVGSALPLTSALALTGLAFLGIPIHQMSVTGLIIALGLLIDNAIVITDEMQHEMEKGVSGEDAIRSVLHRLTVPLASSTATTVLAFLPIALLPGGVGEFVGSIAKAVILALLASLALSLTVLPALMLWLYRGKTLTKTEFAGVNLYRRLLHTLLGKPLLGVGLTLMVPITGFVLAGGLAEQFFPPTDRDQFRLLIELPSQSSQHNTTEVALKIRKHCQDHPRVEDVHWFMGRSAPKFYYNLLQNREKEANFAEAMVVLDSPFGSGEVIRDLQKSLDQEFPGTRARAVQLEQGPPFEAPVEFHLYGPDLETLRHAGEVLRAELARYPEVVQTQASLSKSRAKLSFALDERQVRRAGLDATLVAQTLAIATEGSVVGNLADDTEELPVRVRLQESDRASMSDVQNFDFQVGGKRLYLGSLGRLEMVSDRAMIGRRYRRRVNTVQAFLDAGVLPSSVLEPVLAKLESGDLELPTGVTYQVGGEAAERNRAVGNLVTWLPALSTLMVGALVMAFGSFRLAALVGVVGLLSAGPGLGALYILGIPFGFNAIIGCMGLLGVAINDSTVVLAALLDHPQAREGEIHEVVEVVIGATRHVVATTLTTIAGFLPLLLGADRFWHPLAATIAGGVAGATLLALIFAPAAFRILKGRLWS